MNTRFRPTPSRDLHIGHALCSFLNWQMAKRSGGEFILMMGDTEATMHLAADVGCTPEEMEPRILRDLEWIGCKPDRVVYCSENAKRHAEVAEALGVTVPQQMGRLPAFDMRPTLVMAGALAMGGTSGTNGPLWAEGQCGTAFPKYLVMMLAVDDHDFGVTGWYCGDELIGWDSYYRYVYDNMPVGLGKGATVPLTVWHPTVAYEEEPSKVSKSARAVSISRLREAGYEAADIMETLRECLDRSCNSNLGNVMIPHDVLGVEKVKTLRHEIAHWEGALRREVFLEASENRENVYMTDSLQKRAAGELRKRW